MRDIFAVFLEELWVSGEINPTEGGSQPNGKDARYKPSCRKKSGEVVYVAYRFVILLEA